MDKAIIAIIAVTTSFLLGVHLASIIPLSIAWTVWAILIIILATVYIIRNH